MSSLPDGTPPLLHMQVACARNRVIGRATRLPWHIPEDLDFFHEQTAGQIVLLGRICYETWPRVHSEGRTPVVVTSRQASTLSTSRHLDPLALPLTAPGFPEALAIAENRSAVTGQQIHICGGERIYREALALKRPLRLHLTLVHADIPGDTYFPEWRNLNWRELDRRESRNDEFEYTFFTLER